MDKSILPGMTKRSFPWFTSKPKKKKPTPPQTKPGAMDDDAMKRAKERNRKLKEAADY